MHLIEQATSLLGRTERDPAFVDLMNMLDVALPLKRPPRGESQTNVELPDQQMELLLTLRSELPGGAGDPSDEMVFQTVFVLPREPGKPMEGVPLGIDMTMTREQARAHFGPPAWSSPGSLKNDRWILGDKRMLLCFTSDEQRLRQVAISYRFE